MNKPIPGSFIYRKQATNIQIPVAFADATTSDKSNISSTVQKIFDLIVLDN
mgnify:FL=1